MSIVDPSVLELLNHAESRYTLVVEASKRGREIVNGAMEAYGTIISNNVNAIMKFLTALTLVISVPTLVASLFGMNLGGIPWNSANAPWGFGVVCGISVILAVVSGIFLAKKKMF